jgi:hypothetical protein
MCHHYEIKRALQRIHAIHRPQKLPSKEITTRLNILIDRNTGIFNHAFHFVVLLLLFVCVFFFKNFSEIMVCETFKQAKILKFSHSFLPCIDNHVDFTLAS